MKSLGPSTGASSGPLFFLSYAHAPRERTGSKRAIAEVDSLYRLLAATIREEVAFGAPAVVEGIGQGGGGVAIYSTNECFISDSTFSGNSQESAAGLGGGGRPGGARWRAA